MSDDFLSRWSRRKREAAQSVQNAEQLAAPETLSSAANAPDALAEAGSAKAEDEFDLASLPPLESITSATDVAAFLRAGVPLELSRAALRRAWEMDPSIRDFIGLAENAWDFNDPNAMPGFGPLDQTPEQARELAARIVGRMQHTAEELASAPEKSPMQSAIENDAPQSGEQSTVSQSSATVAPPEIPVVKSHAGRVAISTCSPPVETRERPALHKDELMLKVRRTHGGALPR